MSLSALDGLTPSGPHALRRELILLHDYIYTSIPLKLFLVGGHSSDLILPQTLVYRIYRVESEAGTNAIRQISVVEGDSADLYI